MQRFFPSTSPRKLISIGNLRAFSALFEGTNLHQYYHIPQSPLLNNSLLELDNLKDKIKLGQSKANGNLQTAVHDKLRFLWTYHSNAIEGSKLSLGDTIFFLQEGLTVSGKPLKDFLDAQNHAQAIEYLYEVVRKTYPIDAHLLSSLNALLLKGVEYIPGKDAAGNHVQRRIYPGEYKKDPNYVIQPDGTMHEYVEPHLVSPQIDGLCQWISKSSDNYHPVITAAIAHYNFVRIHPFQDGNGRGARLLMNLVLMRERYFPAIIAVEERKQYISCLKEGDKGNLLPFVQFVAQSIIKTHTQVLDEINTYLSNRASTPSMKN